MSKFSLSMLPDADYFMKKVPTPESMMSSFELPSAESYMNQLPSEEELLNGSYSQLEDISNIEGLEVLGSSSDIIDLSTNTNSLVGDVIDIPAVKSITGKIDSIKEGIKEKTIDGAKKVAAKIGINLPEIPDPEEMMGIIQNMDPDQIMELSKKLEEAKAYAEKYGIEVPSIPESEEFNQIKELLSSMNSDNFSDKMLEKFGIGDLSTSESDMASLADSMNLSMDSEMNQVTDDFDMDAVMHSYGIDPESIKFNY